MHADELMNCFEGNVRETSERRRGVRMDFFECTDTMLN